MVQTFISSHALSLPSFIYLEHVESFSCWCNYPQVSPCTYLLTACNANHQYQHWCNPNFFFFFLDTGNIFWIWEQVATQISVWHSNHKSDSKRYTLSTCRPFFQKSSSDHLSFIKLLEGLKMYSWWWCLHSIFLQKRLFGRVWWNIKHWQQIAWEQMVLVPCKFRTKRLKSDDKPKQKLWQTLQRKPSRTSQSIPDLSSWSLVPPEKLLWAADLSRWTYNHIWV